MNIIDVRADGTPGITLQGKRGEKGNKGCSNISFPMDSSIGICMNSASTAIGSVTKIELEEFKQACGIGDYIIHPNNEMVYLYKAIKTANDNIEKPDSVECLDSWICDESFDIAVVAKTTFISYDKAVYENDSIIPKNGNQSFISFDVLSNDVNKNLGLIRVEAEFISKNITAGIYSALPEKWNNDDPAQDSNAHPFGYLKNYSTIENMDKENLGNFKIVIKDFSDGFNATSYSSTAKIRKQDVEDYTIKLYVYSKKSGAILRKEFLGEFNTSEL